ncbi:MAG: sialidase family protein, partial [Candidatus Thermoplasmatota archaeon]|nr:sialidase family protein [Candidatus Thermoplasmatota archaeon]
MKSIKFVVVLLIFLSLLIVANGNEIHSDYETGILTSEYTNSSDIQSLTTMSEENRQSIFLKKSILMETVFTVPAITSYNGNLYFLSDWYYSDTGKHSIELMKSSDYGDSWSNPVTVTEENGSMFKSMTSDKTAIYVTYSKGNDIYFQKSTDGGLSFSGPEIIGSAEHLIQFVPNIILDSNDVYVIYSSSPDKKTVVSVILKTSDGGNTWEKIDEIPSDSAVCIYKKLIYKFSIQNGIINFRTSNDAGNSWSGLQPVHLGEQIIEVSADNNDIHLLYIKDRYLFHTFSLNGGITWSAPVRIDTDVLGHDAIINHLETTSDAIYVLYNKYNGIQYNSFDLWFKESSDNGLTWSSPVKVGKDVGVPTIESDDKYIYVVGHDGDKSSSTYSHVCLYKYFKSATNPSPVIVNLETEPWSHEKETATISVTVKNEGGFSSEGHISVSFPNGEEVVSVSGTGDTHIIYPTGSTIWGKSGQIDSSEYPLVELVKYGWSGGESETINIEVKPNELSDEMIFYIRAALKNYENADYERI